MGQPETFTDLGTANAQLGARDNAPFASTAPGAFRRAYAPARGAARSPTPRRARRLALGRQPARVRGADRPERHLPGAQRRQRQYGYTAPLGFRTLTGRITSFAYDPSAQGRYFASPTVGGVWESTDAGTPGTRSATGCRPRSSARSPTTPRCTGSSSAPATTRSAATGSPGTASTTQTTTAPPGSSRPAFPISRSASGSSSRRPTRAARRCTPRPARACSAPPTAEPRYVNENLPTSPAGYSPNCAGRHDQPAVLLRQRRHRCDRQADRDRPTRRPGAVIAAVGWRAGQKVDTDANGNNVTGCTLNGRPPRASRPPERSLQSQLDGAPGSFTHLAPAPAARPGLPPTTIQGRTALGRRSRHRPELRRGLCDRPGRSEVQWLPGRARSSRAASACNATVTGEAIATVLDGMYASYDFGKTWTKIMDYAQLKQAGTGSALLGEAGYNPGIQSWYNLWVEADPTTTDAATGDPTRVLFGLEEIWENNQVLPLGRPGGQRAHHALRRLPGGHGGHRSVGGHRPLLERLRRRQHPGRAVQPEPQQQSDRRAPRPTPTSTPRDDPRRPGRR